MGRQSGQDRFQSDKIRVNIRNEADLHNYVVISSALTLPNRSRILHAAAQPDITRQMRQPI